MIILPEASEIKMYSILFIQLSISEYIVPLYISELFLMPQINSAASYFNIVLFLSCSLYYWIISHLCVTRECPLFARLLAAMVFTLVGTGS